MASNLNMDGLGEAVKNMMEGPIQMGGGERQQGPKFSMEAFLAIQDLAFCWRQLHVLPLVSSISDNSKNVNEKWARVSNKHKLTSNELASLLDSVRDLAEQLPRLQESFWPLLNAAEFSHVGGLWQQRVKVYRFMIADDVERLRKELEKQNHKNSKGLREACAQLVHAIQPI